MMDPRNDRIDSLLNLHAFAALSYANGPGARAVVWTQGCSRNCPGCRNPLTHSHGPQTLVDPARLAEVILAIPVIEGLTITGGEPAEQPLAVGLLCRAVREVGLSVMVSTGWTLEELSRCRDRAVQILLSQIDILVDGPFIRHLADKNLLWRGSRNQQVHFLTNRYSPEVFHNNNQIEVEGQLTPRASLRMTGFPEESDIAILSERLAAEAGIVLEPDEVMRS